MELTINEAFILALLLENPRRSKYSIAKRLGLCWSVVHEAMKRLNQSGYLNGKRVTDNGVNLYKHYREIFTAPVESAVLLPNKLLMRNNHGLATPWIGKPKASPPRSGFWGAGNSFYNRINN